MASVKAIAAIALTLMIAMPILLGFAMSSEEITSTRWTDTSSSNLSNEILNNETIIYGPYDGPNNNTYLLNYVGLSPSLAREVPDYNEVSEIYTSLPIYDTTSATFTLASGTAATYTTTSIGNTGSGATTILGSQPYQYVDITNYSGVVVLSLDGTDHTLSLGGKILALQNGSTYSIYVNASGYGQSQIYDGVTLWKLSATSLSLDTYVRGYSDLTIATDYSFPIVGASSVKITHSNGTVEYANPYRSLTTLTTSNTVLEYDSPGFLKITTNLVTTSYTDVTDVSVATYSTNGTVTYSAYTPSGDYANPGYGWELPVSDVLWYNSFENESVRMLLKLDDGDQLNFSITGIGANYTIARSSGVVTVAGDDLGAYTYLMVDFGMQQTTVAGISAWPSIGVTPGALNSITLTYPNALTAPFEQIKLSATNTPDIRIDSASIAMGTFPSTKNYTLDLDALYPGKSFSLKFNSIGIYGDSITFGGETYTPALGKIVVDGRNVSLKGATFSAYKEDGEYTLYINGIEIGSSASAPSLTFGGEWSLTITASLMDQTTDSRMQWVPGGFAFTKEDFAACGILVAGGLLVGLGMYGARSGIKIGLLLLICGGGALIYLTMV